MKKLTKFDSMYNKFIYEWSSGNTLDNILNNIKDIPADIPEKNDLQEITYTNQFNDLNKNDYIRNNFNQVFPKYLIKKCQTKFPIEDNVTVPDNIIDNFWERYSEKILNKLADVAIEKISDCFYNILLDVFGKDSEYDENICNNSAIQLVNLNN